MNQRDYRLYLEGREAAERGAGLSDTPYGGRDGNLWRRGLLSWINDNEECITVGK